MSRIKVGFCVAYDWELLKDSLPAIYNFADIICLAVDVDRHSWSCNPYTFDSDSFYAFVRTIDIEDKIDIYEDDFSLPELNARENCNRHRSMIADKMGMGGWHIQIDCDEYFVDFEKFVSRLTKICSYPTGKEKPLNVLANLITLYKKLQDGYLLVDSSAGEFETVPIATNVPHYERARQNGHFNIYTDSFVLHESWARTEEELQFKISNWGHSAEELSSDLKQDSYISFWLALDKFNYKYAHNFHPANPTVWRKLKYFESRSIKDLISIALPGFPHSMLWLKVRNNRNIARIRHLVHKIFGNA